jgi:hypothetical protein
VPLGAFLARELAPSHRRLIEAARNATKATITTGLTATMQILGPFGPLFADGTIESSSARRSTCNKRGKDSSIRPLESDGPIDRQEQRG